LAAHLSCFVCDLDRMPWAELMGWSRYFKEKETPAPDQPDWGSPQTVADMFKL